jgi:hypothetical protein
MNSETTIWSLNSPVRSLQSILFVLQTRKTFERQMCFKGWMCTVRPHFRIRTTLIQGCRHIGHPWSAHRQLLAQSSQATKWLVMSLLAKPKCKNAWVRRFSMQIMHRSEIESSSGSLSSTFAFLAGVGLEISGSSRVKVSRLREVDAWAVDSGSCGRSEWFRCKKCVFIWLSISLYISLKRVRRYCSRWWSKGPLSGAGSNSREEFEELFDAILATIRAVGVPKEIWLLEIGKAAAASALNLAF